MPTHPLRVFVLWWQASEGPDLGIERVYDNVTRANEDFDLAQKSRSTQTIWHLDEVPFFSTAGPVMRTLGIT